MSYINYVRRKVLAVCNLLFRSLYLGAVDCAAAVKVNFRGFSRERRARMYTKLSLAFNHDQPLDWIAPNAHKNKLPVSHD